MPPQRTCIGCRRKGDQGSFLRVSRLAGGRFVVWERGEAGRSAYICSNEGCVAKALEKERLNRALKVAVRPDERARIREELICKLR